LVDVYGLEPRPPIRTPGDSPFPLARDAHRELAFQDRLELREFVDRLTAEFQARNRVPVNRQEIHRYVKARFDAGDSTWVSICNENPKWAKESHKLS